jgi:hypothetical protein
MKRRDVFSALLHCVNESGTAVSAFAVEKRLMELDREGKRGGEKADYRINHLNVTDDLRFMENSGIVVSFVGRDMTRYAPVEETVREKIEEIDREILRLQRRR